jgi:hypothetical protein
MRGIGRQRHLVMLDGNPNPELLCNKQYSTLVQKQQQEVSFNVDCSQAFQEQQQYLAVMNRSSQSERPETDFSMQYLRPVTSSTPQGTAAKRAMPQEPEPQHSENLETSRFSSTIDSHPV